MSLLRYIKGLRHGKEAHRIELEAMKNPFLSEALEGYDAIDDNHLKRIARLQKQVKNRGGKKINIPSKKWGIVVILLLCLSLAGYFFIKNYESFFKRKLPVDLLESYEKADSVKIGIEKDTVKQQDTPVTNIPELPLPKNNRIKSAKTLQDSLKENGKEVEIMKLDAPPIQLRVPVAPKPENGNKKSEIEVLF